MRPNSNSSRAANSGEFELNALKRFISDAVLTKGERKGVEPPVRTKDEKIAILVSGPAGLSAAHYLVRMAYGVTVFEAESNPGGMMVMGIPEYRLPRETLEADLVISAIGEVPDLSFLDTQRIEVTQKETIKVNPYTMATTVDGIFAGGDVVSGPSTVIGAIAAGSKAVIAIDRYLCGKSLDYELSIPGTIESDDVETGMLKKCKRRKMLEVPPKKRVNGFREVEQGFTELVALAEADRCFQCGMFPNKQR